LLVSRAKPFCRPARSTLKDDSLLTRRVTVYRAKCDKVFGLQKTASEGACAPVRTRNNKPLYRLTHFRLCPVQALCELVGQNDDVRLLANRIVATRNYIRVEPLAADRLPAQTVVVKSCVVSIIAREKITDSQRQTLGRHIVNLGR